MEEQNLPQSNEEKVEMSEVSTLTNIFFEPGRTFEALRKKPRFILAILIMMALTVAFQVMFVQKVGDERLRRATAQQIEKGPNADSMSAEQKKNAVEMGMTIGKYIRYVIPVIFVIIFLIGGLIYWLAGNAMGGTGTFLGGLSVWVYSSFPPLVLGMIGNFIVLFLKSADEIDIAASQRGLIHANPTMFFEGKEMPVLATLLATIDVFQIWGWILAAIGLRVVAKISNVSAWSIVGIMALIGIAFRVLGAVMSGNPN